MANPYARVNAAAAKARALPRVVLPSASRGGNLRNSRLGATAFNPNKPFPPYTPVTGQPSMKLIELHGGGAETLLERRSQWVEFFSTEDVRALESIMKQIVNEAKRLSRGRLSYKDLRDRGNPYGRGGRRKGLGRLTRTTGVSNLAVVNLHSGAFLSAWSGSVEFSKSKVRFHLVNTHFAAWWLAEGTPKMRAHGPFTTAMVRHLAALNRLFAAAARRAYERAKMEAMLSGS